jgi:hypothetical protein
VSGNEARKVRSTFAGASMLKNVRVGFRSLVKARGFSVAAIAVMALCIRANTAIFSVVNSVYGNL